MAHDRHVKTLPPEVTAMILTYAIVDLVRDAADSHADANCLKACRFALNTCKRNLSSYLCNPLLDLLLVSKGTKDEVVRIAKSIYGDRLDIDLIWCNCNDFLTGNISIRATRTRARASTRWAKHFQQTIRYNHDFRYWNTEVVPFA
jgi:hypothetical protein